MLSAWMILAAVLVLYLLSSIKILKEYERGVNLGDQWASNRY